MLIRLIDFGRAIKNRAVSPSVPFTGKCYTSNFSCPQMHGNQEWSYQVLLLLIFHFQNRFQIDLYALGMSLHVIMFGDYSKIDKKTIKKRRVPVNFGIPRHFDRSEWKTIFDSLLNHSLYTVYRVRPKFRVWTFRKYRVRQKYRVRTHPKTVNN